MVGESAGGGREEDEGLVAKVGGGDGFALCEVMIAGEYCYEGFGEEGFDGESVGGVAVAEEGGVDGVFCEGLDQV